MSVLLFFISVLVLLYLNTRTFISAPVLIAATGTGAFLNQWAMVDTACGALLLTTALLVIVPNPLRRRYLSLPLLRWVRGRLPQLSDTEAQALRSGSVDWDGELFSGHPHWPRLLEAKHHKLTPEEQAFLDGPVETLCSMLNDWQINNELFDLPQDVWTFIRNNGFFGLILPKEYGGLGFSAVAHSEIVMRISTRSVSAAVTVMVPNSLGPGELLLHYGTEEQKALHLPRLSSGVDIPCFALTSPVAGSDAGAIPDKGIVCEGEWQGQRVLGLRITWNKRYITLAPVATLIGLAIKVYDPERLLGGEDHIGVTCVLVPHDLPGVNSGSRHLPMDTAFMNGPTWGNDVFIPMDCVIGGQARLGQGWTMLMECLAIGRSISLPALATGAGKLVSLAAGSYARVREQFGRPISRFEGIQEALEPIAGYTYMMDAARLLTASMLDRGVRPAVPSALLKYRSTDLMRIVINHGMDVVAGRGVIGGPRNFIAQAYQAVPIGITVEGANILTRSLIMFGQGAIRCHPFIVEEIEAAGMADETAGAIRFDRVFYRHVAHTLRNALRTGVLGLSCGLLTRVPATGNIRRYYRQLNRLSAAFATLTDAVLLLIGGNLKARQRLSGRMADCLVQLYYASAVIKQWHEDGYPEAERPLVEWCLQTTLHDLQQQMQQLIDNFPVRLLRWPLRLLVFPFGAAGLGQPDDQLGGQVAASIVEDTPVRDRITRGVYLPGNADDSLGRVLNAFRLANQTQQLRDRLHAGLRKRDPDEVDQIALLMGHQRRELVDWAVANGIIGQEQHAELLEALNALYDVIRVDAFDADAIKTMADQVRGQYRVVVRK